jgi:hypothetical protein
VSMWTDEQAIFNVVRDHLLAQKCQSAIGNMCQYKGPNGRQCAVGVLMTAEFYTPKYEGSSVGELPEEAIAYLGGWDMVPLLRDLQEIHDNGKVRDWQRLLEVVAGKHGLTP